MWSSWLYEVCVWGLWHIHQHTWCFLQAEATWCLLSQFSWFMHVCSSWPLIICEVCDPFINVHGASCRQEQRGIFFPDFWDSFMKYVTIVHVWGVRDHYLFVRFEYRRAFFVIRSSFFAIFVNYSCVEFVTFTYIFEICDPFIHTPCVSCRQRQHHYLLPHYVWLIHTWGSWLIHVWNWWRILSTQVVFLAGRGNIIFFFATILESSIYMVRDPFVYEVDD